jgi:hypothetical protein
MRVILDAPDALAECEEISHYAASALLRVTFATHNRKLGLAAQALGFPVLGL